MFEKLFERRHVMARHCAAPLLDERRRFLAHLANRDLSLGSLQRNARLLLKIVDALGLANRPGKSIAPDELKRRLSDKPHHVISFATQWLHFLGWLKQQPDPANPYAEKIKAFAYYMEHETSLSPVTIKSRSQFLQRFLGRLGTSDGSLHEITIARLDQALVEMISQNGYARGSVQTFAGHLRAFLRYAEKRGWCRNRLADAIKSPPVFTQTTLPTGPSWDEVRRLLAMTEGNRPADIRDRAILMLLAVYGLRAGEVSHLQLHDFDWERELLSVTCSKTRRTRTYPLVRPVGDAVLRYLKEIRPRSARREVFLTLFRPSRPVYNSLWRIVAVRLRHLGVSLPHLGPHALRHACASHLLAQGLSLKEIGDHLGHRQPDTTRIYAKVDLIGLRRVADFDLGGLL